MKEMTGWMAIKKDGEPDRVDDVVLLYQTKKKVLGFYKGVLAYYKIKKVKITIM